MIPDLDILRAAQLLVKRHGADARIVAAQRADELFNEGHLGAALRHPPAQPLAVAEMIRLVRALAGAAALAAPSAELPRGQPSAGRRRLR